MKITSMQDFPVNLDARARVYLDSSADSDKKSLRVSHLAIGAHPDDVEIIGIHGIWQSRIRTDKRFGGIVVTNGAGSPRGEKFSDMSEARFVALRSAEQLQAAELGGYAALLELNYESADLGSGLNAALVKQLRDLIVCMQPDVLYLHNPFDRHSTHASLCLHCIEALHGVPVPPDRILGIEVWRSLDWLPVRYRIELDIGDSMDLQTRLLRVYRSQIESGKRYDQALTDRARANATLNSERAVDQIMACQMAVDLRHLLEPGAESLQHFAEQVLSGFSEELLKAIERCQ